MAARDRDARLRDVGYRIALLSNTVMVAKPGFERGANYELAPSDPAAPVNGERRGRDAADPAADAETRGADAGLRRRLRVLGYSQ